MNAFRKWRIRKTREKVAYWTAKFSTLKIICSHDHSFWEQNALVEAASKKAMYEARLNELITEN